MRRSEAKEPANQPLRDSLVPGERAAPLALSGANNHVVFFGVREEADDIGRRELVIGVDDAHEPAGRLLNAGLQRRAVPTADRMPYDEHTEV